MFKKLKDKLAEEVKSSPQRIQQFAQAAQAAVTSASSSISDITNSDLFSIGDNDPQTNRPIKLPAAEAKSTYQEVALVQPGTVQNNMDSPDFSSNPEYNDGQRQRRLSNSSFASDVSFRLPSYESPSMYHLQSDMEISASEAEERGFSSGNVSLDRVTKEQIYAAYRRTQQRYTKYRTQYADLARHYKLLERENAKAKSVLVETQDKALRRISELREQCSLEQSAKAHLEKALRIEMEEKNLKIDTLNTKIQLLQNNDEEKEHCQNIVTSKNDNENNMQLISFDSENNHNHDDVTSSEIMTLKTKVEKLETLVNKYKESLKATKDKNAQLTTEIQILNGDIDTKNKEIEDLKSGSQELQSIKVKLQELKDLNEELQNKINIYEFNKNKEVSSLELDYQKAQEEIAKLKSKIEVFNKREEEYAISLAENKLSIHKELEGKESEIKSLKDLLAESRNEVQSLNIVLTDYKNNITSLESECTKLKNDSNELNFAKSKISALESEILELTDKCQALETAKSKAFEEYKCLQLQLKQETAEKLAMVDRNTYLESRNTQLNDENAKKTLQISTLDKELQILRKETSDGNSEINEEIQKWKHKCSCLESEILEEREELVKLQTEIEKLLANDDLIQIQNSELNTLVNELKLENTRLTERQSNVQNIKVAYDVLLLQIKDLRKVVSLAHEDTKSLKEASCSEITKLKQDVELLTHQILAEETIPESSVELNRLSEEYESILKEVNTLTEENFRLKSELVDKERMINDLDHRMDRLNKDHENTFKELQASQQIKAELSTELEKLTSKCEELQRIIIENNNENTILKEHVAQLDQKVYHFNNGDAVLQEENRNLGQNLKELEAQCKKLQAIVDKKAHEHEHLKQQISEVNEKNICLQNEYDLTLKRKEELEKGWEDLNLKCEKLQEIVDSSNNDRNNLRQQISGLSQELSNVNIELENLHVSNKEQQEMLKTEMIEINKLHAENIQQLNKTKQDNEILQENLRHKEHVVENLHQNIAELTQENIAIKSQSETIANNIKELENELSEVRKSHTEIENEKDHLNTIIDKLEKKESEMHFDSKQTQTGADEKCEVKMFEEKQVELPLQTTTNIHLEKQMLDDNDSLKNDNKRLQSDIAGLQTYLAQISRENSILNDKIRELTASSGIPTESYNNKPLDDKLEELIRENKELEEENLELKDQLKSQHYSKQDTIQTEENLQESELKTLKEKYSKLVDVNSKLESRLLEFEEMNKSFNINMQHMQEQNEKLRLSNEKLERRLDEALVSLRHLHSLQENTELEYLRNILYEYLTGTGTHSVTLAKVLAAVVKFDKAQTDAILQKEKERQGFLRQLGLL